jgi:predicted transcriptional regulator
MNKIFISSFISILFFSCNSNQQQVPQEKTNQENPVALQENKFDMSSLKKGRGDLIEELYAEIANQSDELKNLEKDLKQFQTDSKYNKLKDDFNQYDFQSKRYYQAADDKLTSLKDSILRNRISELVKKSKNQYSDKIVELESLSSQIDNKQLSIEDHYNVLKILRTLPVIEKYQKSNLPKNAEYQDHLSKQEKLLQKIKNLTDK